MLRLLTGIRNTHPFIISNRSAIVKLKE